MAALQELRKSARDFPFSACVCLHRESRVVAPESSIVVLSFKRGASAALILVVLVRTGKEPNFQSFITFGPCGRVLPLRNEAEGKAAVGWL
jgi:hypothetical protein